jgi:Ca-activated chloride channel family protein
MSQFNFEYPWILLLIVLFWVCHRWCRERSQAIFFPHISTLVASNVKKSPLLSWLKYIGVVLAITALASPVITTSYTNSNKNGRDIVLVLDSSGSMNQFGFDENDIYKSKFDVVKDVVGDFIKKRESDRIGMITFGDVSFISSPLTFESDFLEKILKRQRVGVAGEKTAINDALTQAYSMLSKSKAKSKVVILLTDGIDNMSRVTREEVLSLIKDSSIKLYTIAIGRAGDYNAPYLDALARASGGEFFATDSASGLKKIYEQIDKLEVSKLKDKKIIHNEYLYIYPLFIAILSLLLFVYLRSSKGVE